MNIQKTQCTGCYACYNICPQNCISMVEDLEGFLYPQIDEGQCILCGLCDEVCPINCKKELEKLTRAFGVINKDEMVRINSSSGGFFTILAEYVLCKSGVVYGAAYDEMFEVKHICIEKTELLYKLRGAKYVQSRQETIYKDIKLRLKNGQWVLFSGTACQVAGLKSYLRKEYPTLICVDIICHGVPSPKVWRKYIHDRAQNRKISKINMRDKQSGWSRYNYSTKFEFDDGVTDLILSSQDYFMKAFVNDLCLRPSCYECNHKGIERISDFTLGDYWGVWEQCEELDDDKGTSLVFVHSDKGYKIFEHLKDNITYREVDVYESVTFNPSMINSSVEPPGRKKFMDSIEQRDLQELVIECLGATKAVKLGVVARIKRRLLKR